MAKDSGPDEEETEPSMSLSSKCIVVGAAVLLLGLVLLIVYGDNGLVELSRLRSREHAMAEKNETLARQNVDRYRIIGRLRHDPLYIDHVARHELGMVGKDDLIVIRQAHGQPER
jgi:cell division protein FtsB